MLTKGTQVVSVTIGGNTLTGVLGYDDATNKLGLYDPQSGADEGDALVTFDAGEAAADLEALITAGTVVTPIPVTDHNDGTSTVSIQDSSRNNLEVASLTVPGPGGGPQPQTLDLGDGVTLSVTAQDVQTQDGHRSKTVAGALTNSNGGVVGGATWTVPLE